MPTVEIRVSTYANGIIPHTFLVITGADGTETVRGFSPTPSGLVNPGHVGDDTGHPYDDTTDPLPITEQQYLDLMDYIGRTTTTPPEYDLPEGSQCTVWVLNGLAEAGIIPSSISPITSLQGTLPGIVDTLAFNPYTQKIGFNLSRLLDETSTLLNKLKDLFGSAEVIRSPLVLDLNGDGVTTVSEDAGVHFDFDGNGFAELTGWAGKDDGILVRDLNGNGTIDNGTELFGNYTVLADGQKAANGFTALAELDTNNDGVVDSAEAAAAGIYVWKDANQNGITDAGELLTLEQASVSSISTGYASSTDVDTQGNSHLSVGTYTDTTGNTHEVDDVWFQVDTARTQELNTVTVSAEIEALPDIGGMGNVHSLHQAMALDTSGHLEALVEEFLAADSFAQSGIATELIYAWAGVENLDPNSRGSYIGDARRLASLEAFLGEGFLGTWCWGTLDPNPNSKAVPLLLTAFDDLVNYVSMQLLRPSTDYLFNALKFGWDVETAAFSVDVSGAVALLEDKYTSAPSKAIADLQVFYQSLNATTAGQQVVSLLRSAGNVEGNPLEFQLATLGYDEVIVGDDQDNTLTVNNTTSSTFVYVGAGNDTVIVTGGTNAIDGGAGDDVITASGNNTIYGGTGNDTIAVAAQGVNVIDGGSGDDSISVGSATYLPGEVASYSDTITGGQGNDTITGGSESDTYVFNRGDGQDTILDNSTETDNPWRDAWWGGVWLRLHHGFWSAGHDPVWGRDR